MLASLLSLVLLFPVSAIVSPAVAATPGNCTWPGGGNYHNGITADPYNYNTARGVRATIWSNARIAECIGPNILDDVGASYWVALTPAPGNPSHSDTNAIMQIGVIRCEGATFESDSPCNSGRQNTPRFFWAVGGCSYSPVPHDFGPALGGAVTFTIYRASTGNYVLEYDNGTQSGSKTILGTDNAIGCWLTGSGTNASGQFYCERWDTNDACGGTNDRVAFRDVLMQKSVGGTWFYPGQLINGTQYGFAITQGDCTIALSDDHCDVREDLAPAPGRNDDWDLWTVN